jgi:hypothetical protein
MELEERFGERIQALIDEGEKVLETRRSPVCESGPGAGRHQVFASVR